MNIDKSKPVLVTGGNGYIASWLVKYLLEDGVNVHATVRDPNNQAKVAHLLEAAEGASGKLTLFPADLLTEGSFDAAMAGCELIFHTASPFVARGIKDPQKQLVEPAETGTRNVLETANRVASVKRVVLTTSVAAIYGDAADVANIEGDIFDESHWNESSSLEHQPYSYSKTVAERLAWKIAAAQDRWDLVCINPGMVLGPSLASNSDSESLSLMKDLGRGKMRPGAPGLEFGIVDVRDVAIGHMLAGFTATASGRHILVSESMSLLDIAEVLREKFGKKYGFPTRQVPKLLVWLVGPTQGLTRKFVDQNVGWAIRLDNSYAKQDLGISFRPVKDTVIDHFQQMLDDGVVRKKG